MHYGTKPGQFETSKIHFPTSEGVSEVSGVSERANGRASDPVLQSVFLAVLDHSVMVLESLISVPNTYKNPRRFWNEQLT